MGCTVFANDDGFFHQGSSGTGKAFPDVCLSPPPPPAGPVPIPYPNNLMASDLASGSKSVQIQGQPTALENSSYVSTSTGNEAATQGGGVLSHQTKGKGYFSLWSFDVKVEGKGVDRHGDPIGQNCGSDPFNGLAPQAKTDKKKAEKPKKKCKRKYTNKDRHGSPTEAQKVAANNEKPLRCWECKSRSPLGNMPPPPRGIPKPYPPGKRFVADHQPPCMLIFYAGGCHDEDEQEERAKKEKGVKPHCAQCSSRQGGLMSSLSRALATTHGL